MLLKYIVFNYMILNKSKKKYVKLLRLKYDWNLGPKL